MTTAPPKRKVPLLPSTEESKKSKQRITFLTWLCKNLVREESNTHLFALKSEKGPTNTSLQKDPFCPTRIQALRSVRKRDGAGNAGKQDGDEEENIGSNGKIKIIL